jgi:hexosaminidase
VSSEKGAYHPLSHVYSQKDVKAVIEYCRLRGIRVIPEFDTPGQGREKQIFKYVLNLIFVPGHTRSWGEAHPELLTSCYGSSGAPDGSLGPMDPTKKSTHTFVKKFLKEVAQVFPDKFLHIGGDEVDTNCW